MFHGNIVGVFFFKRKLFPPPTPPPPFTQKEKCCFLPNFEALFRSSSTNKQIIFPRLFLLMFRAILEEHQRLSFIILNFYGAFLTMSLSSYYILNIYPFYFEGRGGGGYKDTTIIIMGVVLAIVPYY